MEGEARGDGNDEGKGGPRMSRTTGADPGSSGADANAAAPTAEGAAAAAATSIAAAAASSASGNNKPTRTHGERWEESFRRLVAFQKRHGHCNIPYRYEEDPFLGRWVSLQRSIYKGEAASAASASGSASSSALATGESAAQRDRIRRLNEIGFEWNPQETRHVSWEQRYGELCDFVARNGHARVPLGWKVRNES
jgi:Helicase associated domain